MPNPSTSHVAAWLAKVTPEYLRDEGWDDAEQRFHGIVDAARAYAKQHFAEQLEQQEAFFDGLALALTVLGHFADIEQIRTLLDDPSHQPTTPPAEVA